MTCTRAPNSGALGSGSDCRPDSSLALADREPDVLDLPGAGLLIQARDATLHRPERLAERSGIIAETLPDLANAHGLVNVAAHEQSGHAICNFANRLAADGLPRLDHVQPAVRRRRVREENVRRGPRRDVHAVIGPFVGKAASGERAAADAGHPPPE